MMDNTDIAASVDAALADMAGAASALPGMEAGIAELVEHLRDVKNAMPALLDAMRQQKALAVNIPQQDAPVVNVSTQQPGSEWEVTIRGNGTAPDRVMTIRRVS